MRAHLQLVDLEARRAECRRVQAVAVVGAIREAVAWRLRWRAVRREVEAAAR